MRVNSDGLRKGRLKERSGVGQAKVGSVGGEALPLGWVRKESRSKRGAFYYAHLPTGHTQAERPVSALSATSRPFATVTGVAGSANAGGKRMKLATGSAHSQVKAVPDMQAQVQNEEEVKKQAEENARRLAEEEEAEDATREQLVRKARERKAQELAAEEQMSQGGAGMESARGKLRRKKAWLEEAETSGEDNVAVTNEDIQKWKEDEELREKEAEDAERKKSRQMFMEESLMSLREEEYEEFLEFVAQKKKEHESLKNEKDPETAQLQTMQALQGQHAHPVSQSEEGESLPELAPGAAVPPSSPDVPALVAQWMKEHKAKQTEKKGNRESEGNRDRKRSREPGKSREKKRSREPGKSRERKSRERKSRERKSRERKSRERKSRERKSRERKSRERRRSRESGRSRERKRSRESGRSREKKRSREKSKDRRRSEVARRVKTVAINERQRRDKRLEEKRREEKRKEEMKSVDKRRESKTPVTEKTASATTHQATMLGQAGSKHAVNSHPIAEQNIQSAQELSAGKVVGDQTSASLGHPALSAATRAPQNPIALRTVSAGGPGHPCSMPPAHSAATTERSLPSEKKPKQNGVFKSLPVGSGGNVAGPGTATSSSHPATSASVAVQKSSMAQKTAQANALQKGTIVWYNGRRLVGMLCPAAGGKALPIVLHGAPNGGLTPPTPGGLMHGTRVSYRLKVVGAGEELGCFDVRPLDGQVGLSCGGDSQIGLRELNEDRTVALDLPDGLGHMVGVFDGHRGVCCADFLAQKLPDSVVTCIRAARKKSVLPMNAMGPLIGLDEVGWITSGMISGFEALDREFLTAARRHGWGDGASALVAMIAHGFETTEIPGTLRSAPGGQAKLFAAWCGIGRMLLLRGRYWVRCTEDHVCAREDERTRLQAAGAKVLQDKVGAWWMARPGQPQLALQCYQGYVESIGPKSFSMTSRGFGDLAMKEPAPAVLSATPEVRAIDLTPEDWAVVLCSRGVFSVLNESEVAELCYKTIALQGGEAVNAAQALTHCALERGATCNVTSIVMRLGWAKPPPPDLA